jgi:hypothetical protein
MVPPRLPMADFIIDDRYNKRLFVSNDLARNSPISIMENFHPLLYSKFNVMTGDMAPPLAVFVKTADGAAAVRLTNNR